MIENGVIHGRFQVLHNDHLKYLLAGKCKCSHLVVGITNPDPTLTREEPVDLHRSTPEANPLTYFERYRLIRRALVDSRIPHEEFSVVPFPINLPELYQYYVPYDATFFLTVCDDWARRKLERFRSLGLRTEVLWEKQKEERGISGTDVRKRMAAGEGWKDLVPAGVAELLVQWDIPARLQHLLSSE